MTKYNVEGFRFMGKEMYEFVKMVAEHSELQDAGAFEYEVNEINAAKMKKSYDALKKLFEDDKDAKFEIQRSPLFHTDYALRVETFYIAFTDIELFYEAIKDAANIDFVTRDDGSIKMGLIFKDVLIEKLK